ncbi:MAG: tetratricopeptide repeat protein [Flavobacteriales bacterium]|nr:tetratricopeptide repeat protein [Flavobacteriales bacterium]
MDRQLAFSYYSEGKFDKAIIYFEKIYPTDNSSEIFDPYFESLVYLEDYKEAHKLVKKQKKSDPDDLSLFVFDGLVYEKEMDIAKADESYQQAISSIQKTTPFKSISGLAKAFEKRNMLDHAIATYQEASKYAGSNNMYLRNIALLYGRQGKIDLMVNSLLDVIHDDERYLVSIQSTLSNSIDFKSNYAGVDTVKTNLIKRTQAYPNKTVYNEMLAWVYMLTENYTGAFIQLKALDKKENNDGLRIKDLGITCINNEQYEQAIKCFDYVIELGDKKPYYREAKIYKVSALKKKVLEKGSYTQDDLLELKSNYLESIDQLGKSSFTAQLYRELAHLEGYYLNNPKEGINILEDLLSVAGLNQMTLGEIKIELGDLMVVDERIWDASLLFMQVEKAFKEDKIGHLAKFKAAQVFYYAGDFEFAQGQLDVLKASTSKLIANDAMELSMLITDNYNMDTTQVTMKLYAAADLLIKQHKYKEANQKFDSINAMFTYHTLNDEILWKKSEMAIQQQDLSAAIGFLEEIVKTYSTDILADNALFELAQIYDNRLNQPEKAAEYYKKIIFEYKGSLFGVQSRKRYREIVPTGGSSDDPWLVPPHFEN